MKKIQIKVWLVLLTVSLLCPVAGILLSGCATPVVVSQPLPPMTNALTGAITPAVAAVITNVPNITYTKLAADGNAIAPFLPSPFGDAVKDVLGLGTLIASIVALRKNGQLNTANSVTTAIVQGVESAGTAAAAVKQSIAAMSQANGVSDAVEATVNKITGSA